MIAPKVNIDVENQRMIFCGRVLNDDKTLSDYNIDDGRVVHLINRATQNTTRNEPAAPPPAPDTNQPRFQTFQSADGSSVLMSSDPASNIFSQLFRHISQRADVANNVEASSRTDQDSSNSRSVTQQSAQDRLSQIRLLLCYVETIFRVIENPANISLPTPFEEPERYTLQEYNLYLTSALRYFDRLKPYLMRWQESLTRSTNSNQQQAPGLTNYDFPDISILMRIFHHLSHIFHALTNFTIDSNTTPNQLLVNVIDNNPRINRTTSSNTTSSSTANSNSNSDSQENSNTITINTAEARATVASVAYPQILVTQSPIVYMELDTTVNDNRGNILDLNATIGDALASTLRALGSGTFDLNAATQDINTNQVNVQQQNQNENSGTTETTTSNSDQQQQETSAENQNSTETTTSNTGTGNNPRNPNLRQFLNSFDPFLSCNSNYTLPELHQATVTADFGRSVVTRAIRDMRNLEATAGMSAPPRRRTDNPQTIKLVELLNENYNGFLDRHRRNSNRTAAQYEFIDFISYLAEHCDKNITVDYNNGVLQMNDHLRSIIFETTPTTTNTDSRSEAPKTLFEIILESFSSFDLIYDLISFEANQFPFYNPMRSFIKENICKFNISRDERGSEYVDPSTINVNFNFNPLIERIFANVQQNPEISEETAYSQLFNMILERFLKKFLLVKDDDASHDCLVEAFEYLSQIFIQFCRVCLADGDEKRSIVLKIILDYYTLSEIKNPRIRAFFTNIVIEMLNEYASKCKINQKVIDDLNEFLKYKKLTTTTNISNQNISVPSTSSQKEIEELSNEKEESFISNQTTSTATLNPQIEDERDSEGMEFSDAFSDMPAMETVSNFNGGTMSTKTNDDKMDDWPSDVPNDWVPIIKKDIEKQKNLYNEHQPPFSDAYLSGMPKKHRLDVESKQDKQK